MAADIRREAKQKIRSLLEHWHIIEVWLKRAEQINAETIIPAINELRYASRQLYLATGLFDKPRLTALEKKHLQKRLILAEQYLLNAEHDVVDAVIGFFRKEIKRIDETVTRPAMVQFFNEYPIFCTQVAECEALIIETRQSYERRAENYKAVRDRYFNSLASQHIELINGEINARYKIADLERHISVLTKAKTWRDYFTRFCEISGLLSFIYSVRIAYMTGVWWPF